MRWGVRIRTTHTVRRLRPAHICMINMHSYFQTPKKRENGWVIGFLWNSYPNVLGASGCQLKCRATARIGGRVGLEAPALPTQLSPVAWALVALSRPAVSAPCGSFIQWGHKPPLQDLSDLHKVKGAVSGGLQPRGGNMPKRLAPRSRALTRCEPSIVVSTTGHPPLFHRDWLLSQSRKKGGTHVPQQQQHALRLISPRKKLK